MSEMIPQSPPPSSAGDAGERIRSMLEESAELLLADPVRAVASAAGALAVAAGEPVLQAESHRAIAYGYEALADYTAAREHAGMALDLYRRERDAIGAANTHVCIGIIERSRGAYGPALRAFGTALETFQEHGDRTGTAATFNNIGVVNEGYGNFDAAVQAYLAALKIYQESGEELHAAIVMANVGNIYYYLGDIDASFEYYDHALAAYRRLGAPVNEAVTLGNISSLYKARGDYDAALNALREATRLFQDVGERRYEAAGLVKIGLLHELRDEPEAASEYFRAAADLAEGLGNKETHGDALVCLGTLLLRQGEYAAAIETLRRGLEIAGELAALRLEYDIHGALAEACEAAGDIPEALHHLKMYAALKDTLFGEERRKSIAETQARFEVERAEHEREVLRLKNLHLEEMMEQKGKESALLAMQLVQRNAFIQKLREDLRKSSASALPEARQILESLLAEIAGNVRADGEWERFEQEFDQIHHDYVRRLSSRYPKLTPTELRVCALLKINLSTKEMAHLLSVSVRNIESHRYSIRKKLGLPAETNLSSYLAAM